MINKNIKIIVVCGGQSTEKEVSLSSGKVVYRTLKENGYLNAALFILDDNNISNLLSMKPDLVYLALHGKGGEDGCIQGALELSNIPYTGSNVETSAICMNKILTKQILIENNLPTAKYLKLSKSQLKHNINSLNHFIDSVGYPLVVKSPREGSSIGVFIVNSQTELDDAIKKVLVFDDVFFLEEYIKGIELTLPIVGNENPFCLEPIEILFNRKFYDYTAKYKKGGCQHIIPANISQQLKNKVEFLGIEAYKALGCKGLSRIDFLIDETRGPMIVEINTLPGMTETSLFPDSASHSGMNLITLIEKVIELGLENK